MEIRIARNQFIPSQRIYGHDHHIHIVPQTRSFHGGNDQIYRLNLWNRKLLRNFPFRVHYTYGIGEYIAIEISVHDDR